MFIGRSKELSKLNRMYKSDKFEMAIIYGRRRVGKTTLINELYGKAGAWLSEPSIRKENGSI